MPHKLRLLRAQVRVEARRSFEAFNVLCDDVLAEHVEVEIVFVVAEGLLDFFTGGNETEIDEGADTDLKQEVSECEGRRTGDRTDRGDGVPAEVVDELEGQEEEVEPYGAGRERIS